MGGQFQFRKDLAPGVRLLTQRNTQVTRSKRALWADRAALFGRPSRL